MTGMPGRPPKAGRYWLDELERLRWVEQQVAALAGDLRADAAELAQGPQAETAAAAELNGAARRIEDVLAASWPPGGTVDHLAEIMWHAQQMIRERTETRDRLAELGKAAAAAAAGGPPPVAVSCLDRELAALADANRHLPDGSVLRGRDTGREAVLRDGVWLDFGGPVPLDGDWRATPAGQLIETARARGGG